MLYGYIQYLNSLYAYIGPPKVTAELVQYVVRGDDATLICNVSGHPKPSVIWRRNGLVIEDEETMKYSEPVVGLLRINNTTKEDTGIYTCIASNSKGKDELNVTLTVLSKCIYFTTYNSFYYSVCLCV